MAFRAGGWGCSELGRRRSSLRICVCLLSSMSSRTIRRELESARRQGVWSRDARSSSRCPTRKAQTRSNCKLPSPASQQGDLHEKLRRKPLEVRKLARIGPAQHVPPRRTRLDLVPVRDHVVEDDVANFNKGRAVGRESVVGCSRRQSCQGANEGEKEDAPAVEG